MNERVRVVPFGEHAVSIVVEQHAFAGVSPAIVTRKLKQGLERCCFPFAREYVASFAHVLVTLDESMPVLEACAMVQQALVQALDSWMTASLPVGQLHMLRTRYDGIDLAVVAKTIGRTVSEVITLHCAQTYVVETLGFLPGFAYLGSLIQELCLPRRATPRARVAAQSVAIAEHQTAVYPLDSPGGWHLIGHVICPRVFDGKRPQSVLFSPGDRVQFVPVDREEVMPDACVDR